METHKKIDLSLDEARELYKGGNKTVKEFVLMVFSKDELSENYFTEVKSFEDAMTVLGMSVDDGNAIVSTIKETSKASAAMYKLNIIRKALNLGQDLHFTKNPEDSYIYYPYNPFVTKSSTYYESDINSGKMEVIGKIKSEGKEYDVLGGDASNGGIAGLGSFYSNHGVGLANATIGFIGCASEEIASHFGKYFGMLITEAKYGDLADFEIIEDKYGNA